MKELIKVEVLKISYKPSAKSYFILLKELRGQNIISLSIGSFEAQTIALALKSIDQARPMIHDLYALYFMKQVSNLKACK